MNRRNFIGLLVGAAIATPRVGLGQTLVHPLPRIPFPLLLADELVPVMPMGGPSGVVFYQNIISDVMSRLSAVDICSVQPMTAPTDPKLVIPAYLHKNAPWILEEERPAFLEAYQAWVRSTSV